ncbi:MULTISPECIES: MraY family glycosyltransferase [unclassified Treponema]|uniref:MraY family glycosyltransferase n=1 Tax=unclassified Treponema TaxID=2638727 RepID=UPI0020A2BC63|nr:MULTISPECIES: MraY family glycosyltransferase [unclassified Treponema]UTC67153.1 undecaprenyl/decaprenyl-phosphate alpha-N-acetylglucosaminyl 1-phosphate transferase [Treponema sp. OMZ 789]UTC69883.1 undecaprenyl/decaprenyl-phosphate alpha-N-acetylglucosaminyl 1-phosphate transferase [Treponema sp. OMZ 790]UTC72598.1 undecaprenyl/decaprenyl-phosphate alpha-N-acetylglucosaminyl 1-phosphate transferase [Treponema sp. OMZ 791]
MTIVQFIFYIMFLPCTLSAFFVYSAIIFSRKHNLYDKTGGRKIHSGNIPRIGGLGFGLAYLISSLTVHFLFPHLRLLHLNFFYIALGGVIIFAMGLWDDIKNWRAIFKLLVQSIAAVLVMYGGYTFKKISFGPIGFFWFMGPETYIITFLWIVGITNAVNLVDGIDGQAGCLGVSVLLTYAGIYYSAGISHIIILRLLILIFAVIGFLFFNLSRPSAKIFMGDCGSQILGFVLAVLPLIPSPHGYEAAGLIFAALILMLPIFDTVAAIWRRIREKRPIGIGDRYHLHHKLMLMGFTPRGALGVFMIFQVIINLFAYMAIVLQGGHALIILIGLILVGILFFMLIHYEKERIVNKKEK